MRVIFFNIWHGQLWDRLKSFILHQKKSTDIFCFIEVDLEIDIKIKKLLTDYDGLLKTTVKTDLPGNLLDGQAIYYQKNISLLNWKSMNLFRNRKRDNGGMLCAEFNFNDKNFIVSCIAGKVRPGTKLDTPARINQSNKILKSLENKGAPIVIGGDFNLLPNTKSIRILEMSGYRNLIKEFNIKNTRNQIAWESLKNERGYVKQYFADYCFVSPEIKVKNFEVPNVEVSDHEPLILDFEI